ncbi:hypothetical protein BKA61DRAFT_670787 [Leptodontidium sp. MPI-SDFR-AT-0119]|nr:hypothetical protein BKA61DRAFT_670787 [Leptodontidium sp. MPI-SDFR-AT-0119]
MPNVSMDGWWQCCRCSEKVFSNWHGVECISCSHGYCRYCYNLGSTPIDSGGGGYTGTLATEDLDVAITASAGMPLASSDTLLHIRPTAQHLPIYIHDYLVNACADSGSQVNCITEDYAKHLGATVKRNCRFPNAGSVILTINFIVFPQLVSRVILGFEFLDSTQTLSKHRHRLKDIEADAGDATRVEFPLVRSVRKKGGVTASVQYWLNGNPIHSLPDTGADLNLMSEKFAASLVSHSAGSAGEYIDHLETTTIQFADCSIITTSGTIRLTVSFPRTSSMPARCVPANSRIIETFHIVPDLEENVILCETLLATVDAFNQHRGNFVSSKRSRFSRISVGKEKKGKERKTVVHTDIPEDNSARFDNCYNNANDCYENKLAKINESVLYGEIEESLVPALKDRTYELFLSWARQNKDRFDRFRPGFYEQKFGQETSPTRTAN